MSPVSRGRKTKKKPTSPQRKRTRSPFEVILANAEVLSTLPWTVDVELWASGTLGELWINSWSDDIDEPDLVFEAFVDDLIAHLVRARTPTALSALRALSRVGEEWTRELFTEAAEQLAAAGVQEPAWLDSAGFPELFEAYSVSDPFGDSEAITLGYRQAGQDHALAVFVDHAGDVRIMRAVVASLPEQGTVELSRQLAANDPDDGKPVPLTPGEVRFRLYGPLDMLLENGPGKLVELGLPDRDDFPVPLLALLQARVDALPHEFTESVDPEGAVTEFLAGEHAKPLPDKELARSWAQLWTTSAPGYGRLPTQAGPMSLAFMLISVLPEHFQIADEDLELLPDIIRAWAHFTADASGLGDRAHQQWDEQLPKLLSDFLVAYRCDEAVEIRTFALELFDFRTLEPDFRMLEDLFPESVLPLPPVPADATDTVHQLKVLLLHTSPPVWRRVEVRSTTTLAELHNVIQAAFDWDNDHLWMFTTDYGQFGPNNSDPDQVSLAQVSAEGGELSYLFDFGDELDHQILVEKVVPAEDVRYPRCTGGRRPDPQQYDIEASAQRPFDKDTINARFGGER